MQKFDGFEWENHGWLVVLTILKNISQLGLLFPIYGKIKNIPNHQPAGQYWPMVDSRLNNAI